MPSGDIVRCRTKPPISAAEFEDLAEPRHQSFRQNVRATPLWGYPERNLRWLTACSAAFNADTRQSAQATEQAFALFPADFHGDLANLKLVHALNQIHDREIDDCLTTCLSVTRARPISAARRRIITQTIDALPEKARDLPAARDLRALITA